MPRKTLERAGLKSGKRRTPGRDVEILATLLVAYPQVSRVTFDPETKTLALMFLCRGPASQRQRAAIVRAYLDSIEVYMQLIKRVPSVVKASWEKMGDLYCFQVERDVASITPAELNVTAELVAERAELVAGDEMSTEFDSEDVAWSARLFLQEMLDQVRNLQSSRKLVALREGEKVLVFDR